MIVRLKDAEGRVVGCEGLVFQFYDSPIKRKCTRGTTMMGTTFQFYDSPIKSCPDMEKYESAFGFNSMIVRLKVDMRFDRESVEMVSIL